MLVTDRDVAFDVATFSRPTPGDLLYPLHRDLNAGAEPLGEAPAHERWALVREVIVGHEKHTCVIFGRTRSIVWMNSSTRSFDISNAGSKRWRVAPSVVVRGGDEQNPCLSEKFVNSERVHGRDTRKAS